MSALDDMDGLIESLKSPSLRKLMTLEDTMSYYTETEPGVVKVKGRYSYKLDTLVTCPEFGKIEFFFNNEELFPLAQFVLDNFDPEEEYIDFQIPSVQVQCSILDYADMFHGMDLTKATETELWELQRTSEWLAEQIKKEQEKRNVTVTNH